MPIRFDNYLKSKFKINKPRIIASWLKSIATSHKESIGDLQYVFCTDQELLQMNRQFLNHDYFTDIITFDYSDEKGVSGDLYISIDRIKDNAKQLGVAFNEELHRVLAHGLLHLIGFKDKSKKDKALMRQEEDKSLKIRPLNLF
jgi:probable rRNA maturation factor